MYFLCSLEYQWMVTEKQGRLFVTSCCEICSNCSELLLNIITILNFCTHAWENHLNKIYYLQDQLIPMTYILLIQVIRFIIVFSYSWIIIYNLLYLTRMPNFVWNPIHIHIATQTYRKEIFSIGIVIYRYRKNI